MSSFLIWSTSHNAWWAPQRNGYTSVLGEAGRYAQADAEELCKPRPKDPNIAFPAPEGALLPLMLAAREEATRLVGLCTESLEVLRSLEWAGGDSDSRCPWCDADEEPEDYDETGAFPKHAENCRLGALIAKLEAPPAGGVS